MKKQPRSVIIFLSSLAQDFIEDPTVGRRPSPPPKFLSSLAQDFIEDMR